MPDQPTLFVLGLLFEALSSTSNCGTGKLNYRDSLGVADRELR